MAHPLFAAIVLCLACCVVPCFLAVAAPASTEKASARSLLPTELAPYYQTWFAQPGAMLSVLGNASDLGACAERVKANASYIILMLPIPLVPDASSPCGVAVKPDFKLLEQFFAFAEPRGFQVDIALGEHNNPFFANYSREFVQKNQDSFMRDMDGNLIILNGRDVADPNARLVPAICDSVISRLASEYIRIQVKAIRNLTSVRNWVIGSETMYPDLFGILPMGDFRSAFIKQFDMWLNHQGINVPQGDFKPILAEKMNPLQAAWFRFREQAMADRAAWYYISFLTSDEGKRPVLFPTHGHPFAKRMRRGLGLSPGLIAGATDGFEMGQITINTDEDNLNLLYMNALSSYGVPVNVPRLANKTLDPKARGGGRTFTPVMIRRAVYECLGMGVNHIGPIDWQLTLPDGEWFIKGTPAEAELAEVFEEIRNVTPYLKGMARLQPRVGLFVADDTWRNNWDPRWTGFFQDARKHHWNLALVGDALVDARLAEKIPILVSLDNALVDEGTMRRFASYLQAGGMVVSWRSFGEQNAFGEPMPEETRLSVVGHKQFLVVPVEREGEPRRLVNRFSTDQGAWEMPHSFRAAPFDAIASLISEKVGEEVPCPIKVRGVSSNGDVTVLPLTDGVSMVAVMINNADQAEKVQLSPAAVSLTTSEWSAYDLLTGARLPMPTSGTAELTLPSHATALVWFVPEVSPEKITETAERAQKAFRVWEECGAQTDFLKIHKDMLQQPPAEGLLRLKAYCLAQRVLSSLVLAPSLVPTAEGGIVATARVFDADGKSVVDACVRLRAVPDTFVWRDMQRDGDAYQLEIPPDGFGVFYDPIQSKYTYRAEARRFVFSATRGTSSGGAGVTFGITNR